MHTINLPSDGTTGFGIRVRVVQTGVVAPQDVVCSARGCRLDARWQLRWRNPRLHDEARLKVWTACDDHRESLGTFLSDRGFLRDVVPMEPT